MLCQCFHVIARSEATKQSISPSKGRMDCFAPRNDERKQKWPGLLPAIFISRMLRRYLGGVTPGGGGGSDAVPPLSNGVMRRTVTRRLIRLGPSVCSFRYCLP